MFFAIRRNVDFVLKIAKLGQLYLYVNEKFPDFRHNKYLRTLNKKQRIIYFFMSRKAFRLVRLMFLIRHMGD